MVTYQQECTGNTPLLGGKQEQLGVGEAKVNRQQAMEEHDNQVCGSDPAAVSTGLDLGVGSQGGADQPGAAQQEQQQHEETATPKAAVPTCLDLSGDRQPLQDNSWHQLVGGGSFLGGDDDDRKRREAAPAPPAAAGGGGVDVVMTEQEQLDRALQESLRDFQQGEAAAAPATGVPAAGGDAYDEEAALMRAIAESEALHREQLQKQGQQQLQSEGQAANDLERRCEGPVPMEVDIETGDPAVAVADGSRGAGAAAPSGGGGGAGPEDEDVVVLTSGLQDQQQQQEGAAAAELPRPARPHVSKGVKGWEGKGSEQVLCSG